MNIPNISFQLPSLITGAIAATLVWVIIWGVIKLLKRNKTVVKELKNVSSTHKEKNIREAYWQFQYDRTQKYHFANQLFALEEILVEPRLITPPSVIDPTNPENKESSIDAILPFLPESSEVISQYLLSTITLESLLHTSGNFYFYGNPGSGKSTALAALSLHMLNIEKTDSTKERKLPLLLHINDIDWRNNSDVDEISLLLESIKSNFPKSSHSNLQNFINQSIQKNQLVILLDGIDELSPSEIYDAFTYLEKIIQNNPSLQIFSTAFGKCVENFSRIKFTPLLIATWRKQDVQFYIESWKNGLEGQREKESLSQDHTYEISMHWGLVDEPLLSPFEWTLRLLGLAGKFIFGMYIEDLIKDYLRGCEIDPNDNRILKLSQSLLESSKSSTNHWETDSDFLHLCINANILRTYSRGRVGFSSPIFHGYFAARILKKMPFDTLSDAGNWSSYYEYVRFLANPHLERTLFDSISFSDPISNIFFLPLAHKMYALNNKDTDVKHLLFKKSVSYLINENLSLGMKLQLLTTFLLHEGQNNAQLLRQLLTSNNLTCRSIGAIVTGGFRIEELIPELENCAASAVDEELLAVLLALSQFEKASAVSIVLEILLQGNEIEKETAAKALASGSIECHKALKQATKMNDILVRKAAIQGISMINEPWVIDFLKQISVDEKQWIVKNEAIAVLESMDSTDKKLEPKYKPPHESEWLIQYASSKGIGISPSKPPIPIFEDILESGTTDEKLGVIDHLLNNPNNSSIEILKTILSDYKDGLIREKAAYGLWPFYKKDPA